MLFILLLPVLRFVRETGAKPAQVLDVPAKSHMFGLLRSTCHLGSVGVEKVEWSGYGGKSFVRESRHCKSKTPFVLNIGSSCVGF